MRLLVRKKQSNAPGTTPAAMKGEEPSFNGGKGVETSPNPGSTLFIC